LQHSAAQKKLCAAAAANSRFTAQLVAPCGASWRICGALLRSLQRIYAAILPSPLILRGKMFVAAHFFVPPPLLQSADDREHACRL